MFILTIFLVISTHGVFGAKNETNSSQIIDEKLTWKIVGGAPAPLGRYPYQVSLRTNGNHFCGGSIIDTTWILTAAHCSINQIPENVQAVVGTNTLNGGGFAYPVQAITYHPEYDPNTLVNDIAVMQVSTPFQFSSSIRPINLASQPPSLGTFITLSGWGLLFGGGRLPNNLQHINLRVLNNDVCQTSLEPFGLVVTKNHVCTTSSIGRGACNGDSGGPLVYHNTQYGVVSYGIPCAKGFPDVFTSVASYREWIKLNTGV